MSNKNKKNTSTPGVYKHYKGNNYMVYGEAQNENNERLILYRDTTSESSYWLRPYSMFFETVEVDMTEPQKRFEKNENIDNIENIKDLVETIKQKMIIISYSEDENRKYVIKKISTKNQIKIEVLLLGQNIGGYLTDFEICLRMGYSIVEIDGELFYPPINIMNESKKFLLTIDNQEDEINLPSIIKRSLNPCSLDLHISNDIFYKTRKNTIDLRSLQNMNNFDKLWKKIAVKDNKGIVLYPHQSIITCTNEIIKIPKDCAGKIEIKSTFARLSLSITTSDFCNPGWEGKFPLQIRNDGNNKVVLYPKTKMLQIILVTLHGNVFKEYKGTYMNDDGTPNKFWVELKKSMNSLTTYNIFNELVEKYEDNFEMQERFISTFPKFYEKNKNKISKSNNNKKIEAIYIKFIKAEKIKRNYQKHGIILCH